MRLSSKKSVLVVDDDETIRKVLVKYLDDNFNVNLIEAKDGSEATFKAQNQNFDLIILDLQMPKLNGVDLIKEMNKSNPDAPLIVLSGFIDKNFISKLKSIKVSGIITKPVTKEKLEEKINVFLE